MTRIVDEDEGRLLISVPVMADLVNKLLKQGIEGIKVGIFKHVNVHLFGSQAYHSLSHVYSVVVDCIKISEALKTRLFAALIIAHVLDDDPLEASRFDWLLHILFHLNVRRVDLYYKSSDFGPL